MQVTAMSRSKHAVAASETVCLYSPGNSLCLHIEVHSHSFSVFVVTSGSFHIINVSGMNSGGGYQPKSIPLSYISEILVPLFPETSFTVCITKILYGRDRFYFIVPDRESIIFRCKQLIAQHEGKRIKVRGVSEEESPSD